MALSNILNGSGVSVNVSTSGYYGTDTKTMTVYKAYVNGLTVIIFNKNTEIKLSTHCKVKIPGVRQKT